MKPQFKIGDKLISESMKEQWGVDYVTITGINYETKVYYWSAELFDGGLCCSGTRFEHAIEYLPQKIKNKADTSRKLLKQLLAEMPKEELRAMIDEVKAMNIEGGNLDDYFSGRKHQFNLSDSEQKLFKASKSNTIKFESHGIGTNVSYLNALGKWIDITDYSTW